MKNSTLLPSSFFLFPSEKDLGTALFAFSKMEIPACELLERLLAPKGGAV